MKTSWPFSILVAFALACPSWAAEFPSANRQPPTGADHTFKLSQAYPPTLPTKQAPWESINFKTEPAAYIRSVLAYAMEGNTDPTVDWDGDRNAVRKWYHVPWMHRGAFPREPMRGLTQERGAPPHSLHPNQATRASNWGVGLYNPRGGYQIGKVWLDPHAPRTDNVKFASGSVSVKLLFTSASTNEVPYLVNSKEWKANPSGNIIQTLRLLQIDIAVRDTDNSGLTGWLFGTFMYNGNAPGATVYDRLVPVGLMWGNDPGVTPTMVNAGTKLQQGWINPAIVPLMFGRNFGWAGRVNGPVDNPRSSCLSCHSTAQRSIPLPSMTGTGNENSMLPWFRNIKAAKLFDEGPEAKSLDYSMQLRVSIRNFLEAQPNPPAGGDDN